MDNNLKILSWNICWGCMKADDTSVGDRSALALAEKCVEIQECLNNVAKLIMINMILLDYKKQQNIIIL